LKSFFESVLPHLDERQRRVVAGSMVQSLGRGGQARVIEASATSSHTVWKAAKEVREGIELSDPSLASVSRKAWSAGRGWVVLYHAAGSGGSGGR